MDPFLLGDAVLLISHCVQGFCSYQNMCHTQQHFEKTNWANRYYKFKI